MDKNKIIKNLHELVDGNGSPIEGDRTVTNNSEIETGPVRKPYNDDSDYEPGMADTMDARIRKGTQKLPWYSRYTFPSSSVRQFESINKTTKQNIEEIVDDLVKKGYDSDLIDNADTTIKTLLKSIETKDLDDEQLNHLEKLIKNKRENKKKQL
jgi:hypothetical protein